MQLSLRLSAIADLVTEGNRLVDVGCDHGYLPVYLIQQKKIPSAIAMDVRKGPLSRAQEHIRQYGLEEYIQTRLSDGLEGLKAGEGDTLVIAGMGGPLMERILTDGRSVRNSFSELILQPQSDIPHFRRFIQSEGWEITEEKMVEEDGKFYPMMRVVPPEYCEHKTADRQEDCKKEEWEYLYGPLLLKNKNPILYEYLKREIRIREDILLGLAGKDGERIKERMTEIEHELEVAKKAMSYYEE